MENSLLELYGCKDENELSEKLRRKDPMVRELNDFLDYLGKEKNIPQELSITDMHTMGEIIKYKELENSEPGSSHALLFSSQMSLLESKKMESSLEDESKFNREMVDYFLDNHKARSVIIFHNSELSEQKGRNRLDNLRENLKLFEGKVADVLNLTSRGKMYSVEGDSEITLRRTPEEIKSIYKEYESDKKINEIEEKSKLLEYLKNTGHADIKTFDDLKKQVPENTSQDILLLKQISERYSTERIERSNYHPENLEKLTHNLRMELGSKNREIFKVLLLDENNEIIRSKNLFYGTLDRSAIYTREIAKEIKENKPSSMLIVHNHPSGNLKPSSADKTITKEINDLANFLDVRLLDHIIISDKGHYSFKENFQHDFDNYYERKRIVPKENNKVTQNRLEEIKEPNVEGKSYVSIKKELSENEKELINYMIKELEKGKIPWRNMEVNPGKAEVGLNGSQFSGANAMKLLIETGKSGYGDNRWLTEKQVQENNFTIKAEAKPIEIELYLLKDKTTGDRLNKELYNQLPSQDKMAYFRENVEVIPKTYQVYNASQIEGIELRKQDRNSVDSKSYDTLMENSNIRIFHNGKDRVFYSEEREAVHMPQKEFFKNKEQYYATALQEIVTEKDGDSSRSKMKGDIAATMLQLESGGSLKETSIANNFETIKQWGEILKEDPKEFFNICKEAQKDVNKLLDMEKSQSLTKDDREFKGLTVKFHWSEHDLGIPENTVYRGAEAQRVLKDLVSMDKDLNKSNESYKTKIDVSYNKISWKGLRLDLGSSEFGGKKEVSEAFKYLMENRGQEIKEQPRPYMKNTNDKESDRIEKERIIGIGGNLIKEARSFYRSISKLEASNLGKNLQQEKTIKKLKGIEL